MATGRNLFKRMRSIRSNVDVVHRAGFNSIDKHEAQRSAECIPYISC